MTEVEKLQQLFNHHSLAGFLMYDMVIAEGAEAIEQAKGKKGCYVWAYHPKTKSFYCSRSKDLSGWIQKVEAGNWPGAPAIIKHMMSMDKKFVYLVGPCALLLQIEHTMAKFSRRAATPRRAGTRFISTQIWALYEVGRFDTSFRWRVTGPSNASREEVVKLANRSMKNSLTRASLTYRAEHLRALRTLIENPMYAINATNATISVVKQFLRMDTDGVIRSDQVNYNMLTLEAVTGTQVNMLTLPGTAKKPSRVDVLRSEPVGKPAFKLN